jgi:hypothetical protein
MAAQGDLGAPNRVPGSPAFGSTAIHAQTNGRNIPRHHVAALKPTQQRIKGGADLPPTHLFLDDLNTPGRVQRPALGVGVLLGARDPRIAENAPQLPPLFSYEKAEPIQSVGEGVLGEAKTKVARGE